MHCRANAQQPKLFVGMILILIFAEALALYGLIGATSSFLANGPCNSLLVDPLRTGCSSGSFVSKFLQMWPERVMLNLLTYQCVYSPSRHLI